MSQQQATNNNQNNKPKERPGIVLDTPDEFKGKYKTDITTLGDLALNVVNRLFGPVFSDYVSCNLTMMNGIIMTTLYFENRAPQDDMVKVVEPLIQDSNDNSTRAVLQRIGMQSTGRTMQLTEDAKQVLAAYIPHNPSQKLNWNNYVTETTQQEHMGRNTVLLQVTGISIVRVLESVYGKETADKTSYLEYVITPLSPVYNRPNDYKVSIMQLNKTELDNAAAKMGIFPTNQNTIPMYRYR